MAKWLCKKSISLFYGYLTEQTKVYYVLLIVLFCKKTKTHHAVKKKFKHYSHSLWKVQESEKQADAGMNPGSISSLALWP